MRLCGTAQCEAVSAHMARNTQDCIGKSLAAPLLSRIAVLSMRRLGVAAIGLVWLAAAGAGLVKLWAYATTPGAPATASVQWPDTTALRRATDRPTLVVFLHPQCPCSRATVGELARLAALVRDRVLVHVLMYRPADAAPRWERTDLWDAAAVIPGVVVSADQDANEAAVFGAFVSGQALLYDRAGGLVFSGGITFARGHAGDNAGRSAIQSLVLHGVASSRRAPVFGCFLRVPSAAS